MNKDYHFEYQSIKVYLLINDSPFQWLILVLFVAIYIYIIPVRIYNTRTCNVLPTNTDDLLIHDDINPFQVIDLCLVAEV